MSEGYVPVPGGCVLYRTTGGTDGTPLLIVHGGHGLPHNYPSLNRLVPSRPIVFYDQLECGLSDRPSNPELWKAARFVREFEQVRTLLGLERVHVLGHSWGSIVALEAYLTRPEGVISLTFASPAFNIPSWIADVGGYRRALPSAVQRTLEAHERQGTTHSKEYEAAVHAFETRHICRLTPWRWRPLPGRR